MICESNYYFIIIFIVLWFSYYCIVEFRSKYKKKYPSHVENDNSIMCGKFELKIFCFHWSGKEFRMLCFFAKHDTLHIAMQI